MRLTTTKKRKRFRTHGYLMRTRTSTGKRVIQRRIRKGRWRVSVV